MLKTRKKTFEQQKRKKASFIATLNNPVRNALIKM